jgi:hypothetical protein
MTDDDNSMIVMLRAGELTALLTAALSDIKITDTNDPAFAVACRALTELAQSNHHAAAAVVEFTAERGAPPAVNAQLQTLLAVTS